MEVALQIAVGAAFFGSLVYLCICTLAGFRPTGQRLSTHHADTTLQPRVFANAAGQVGQLYAAAVRKTPGMRVVEQADGQLLLDCKPSARILGGLFGTVLRVSIHSSPEGAMVITDSSKKVSFAFNISPHRALTEMERALRMRAKKLGLSEVVLQPGSTRQVPNSGPRVMHSGF